MYLSVQYIQSCFVSDLFWLKKNTYRVCLLNEKRKDVNSTYQWLFKDKSQLLRNIKHIKVCLQCFFALSLHMFCLVLYCSSLAMRGESLCASDTQILIVELVLSLLLLPLSHPLFTLSTAKSQSGFLCSNVRSSQSKADILCFVHEAITK